MNQRQDSENLEPGEPAAGTQKKNEREIIYQPPKNLNSNAQDAHRKCWNTATTACSRLQVGTAIYDGRIP